MIGYFNERNIISPNRKDEPRLLQFSWGW